MLWHFTAEFAPQGDIGKHSDEAIAVACGWVDPSERGRIRGGDQGRTSALVSALVSTGFIERHEEVRLTVHDWRDHMPDFVKKHLDRKGLAVIVSGQRQTTADNGSLPLPTPKPLPLPLPQPSQQYGDWPEAVKAVHESFPDCDLPFIESLARASAQTFAGISEPKCAFSDQLLADAIRRVRKSGQNSAGLFSRTVPACIRTWAAEGLPGQNSDGEVHY